MSVGIHIFRKDLRVYDNLALSELIKKVDRVIGVFIYDQKQIKASELNKNYYSSRAAQFVIDSVNDLKVQCDHKLLVLYGDTISLTKKLIISTDPKYVSFNADFTPYSIQRDNTIKKYCDSKHIQTIINDNDQSLIDMHKLVKSNGKPYMVYGTFFNNLHAQPVARPVYIRPKWYKPNGIKNDFTILQWKLCDNIWIGGRKEGLNKLKAKSNVSATDKLYLQTSHLSAYLNQGCLSIREVYWAFKSHSASIELIRSITWRDFFLCIYRFHERGNNYSQFIDERYNKVKWPSVNKKEWNAFMECRTGFLLVDAAMTELLKTGYTNNRCRLILATFWIKYLMINPLNEQYGSQVWFSKLLIDCNAAQNKSNHLWVIGDLDLSGRRFAMKGNNIHPLTGRTMRIDNEMIKKYDADFMYLKTWIPTLKDRTTKECKTIAKETHTLFEWKERYIKYTKFYSQL